MRARDSIGLNLSPLVLRLMLGITFMWAGAGKLLPTHLFTPEQAAALAGMGAIEAPPGVAPVAPLPPVTPPAEGSATPAPTPRYLPEQFPEGVEGRTLLFLALALEQAAHPGFNDDGDQLDPLWPPDLATGKRPVYLAWAVTLTELVAGLAMIIGLFTRLGALGLAGVMLGAIWLTQIGPAIQSGKTTLGFLPAWGAFELSDTGQSVWMLLLYQFSLFAAALAVFFLGAGGLSLDRVVFGGGRKPKPAPSEKHD